MTTRCQFPRFITRLLLAFCLCFFQILNAQDKGDDASLCTMAYNIRYGGANPPNAWPDRRPIMKNLIRSHMPDVIGMQEALFFQVKDLQKDLPEYAWIGLGRDGGSRGEFMAVFYKTSRLEPIGFDHFWLSGTPNVVGSTTWGNENRRMVTWVRFRDLLTGKQFYFLNTHFDHRIEEARVNSAKLIVARLADLRSDFPIVLAGDFNAEAGSSEPFDILTKSGGFADTWDVAQERVGEGINTFNGFKLDHANQGRRIDWILTQNVAKVEKIIIDQYQENGQLPSDHYPVIAWLKL